LSRTMVPAPPKNTMPFDDTSRMSLLAITLWAQANREAVGPVPAVEVRPVGALDQVRVTVDASQAR
jgi:hypothetical protein